MKTITTLQPKKKTLFVPRLLSKLKIQKDNYRSFKQFGYTLFLSLFLLLISNKSQGQAFSATYPFTSVTTSSGLTDPTAVPTATGATFSSFTAVGQTTANPNAASRFSFTGQALSGDAPTSSGTAACVCSGAILTTQYFEVSVTVASGFSVDLTSITFTIQRSGTGIRQYAVRSNADAFAANLAASIAPANANLSVVATNVFQITDATTALQNGSTVTLSGASFTGIPALTTRTFRFYGFNAEAIGGTFSIDNVVINGVATSAAVPAIALSSPSQIADGNVLQGTLNQPISNFQAAVTVSGASLSTVSFVTGNGGGSYAASDITNFKLFYNPTSNTYPSGATQIGTTQAGAGSGSTVTFSGLSSIIANGATGYFWITASINVAAGAGNKFNANASPTLTFLNGTQSGSIAAGGNQTITAATPTITLANGTVAVGNVNQNTFNKVLYRADVNVSVTSATLDSVIFATAGTYSGSDVTFLRLWYSAVDTFSTGGSTLLAADSVSPGPGNHKFRLFSQLFPIGTGYLYVTATFPCAATAANNLYVVALSPSNFFFNSGTPTGSGFTDGGLQTILENVPANATSYFPTVTGLSGQVSLSWTNPSGCSSEIMIVAATSANTGLPTGIGAGYVPGASNSPGTALGNGNVVYKGAGNSAPQVITGLTDETTYFFKIFTRNGNSWSSGVEVSATPALRLYYNAFAGVGACPTQGNTPVMATNSTGAVLSRGTITCSTTGEVFSNTTLNATATINNSSYIEFSATADAGFQLNLTSLTFFRQGSASAPNQLEVRYSTSGFAADSTTWGAAPLTPTNGTVARWDFPDFSTVAAGTVTIRIYPYGTQRCDLVAGSASGGGTFRVDDVSLYGTVVACAAPTITSVTNNGPLCANDTLKLDVVASGTPPFSYFWSGTGTFIPSNTVKNPSVTGTLGASYSVTVTNGCGSDNSSTAVTVIPNVTASVSIVSDATGDTTCTGTNVTFTATPTNGGTPTYAWTLNGSAVGTNSNTYSNNALSNLDTIRCSMTSTAACALPVTAVSNKIGIKVLPYLIPAVSISATPGTNICSGTNVTITAVPTNGGVSPNYEFFVNGISVQSSTTNTYSSTGFNDGDSITCTITSNYNCLTTSTANSGFIKMTTTLTVTPSISIVSNTQGDTLCAGSNVTFTATPINGGSLPSYQWKLNGTNVGTDNAMYSNNALLDLDTITCVLTSNNACASIPTATSNKIGVTVIPTVVPSVSIVSDDANDTICAGTLVTFTATPVNGGTSPSYQWKKNGANVGVNSNSYSNNALLSGDKVSCVMTSNAACPVPASAASDTITTIVNPLPTISVLPVSITIPSYTSTTLTASGTSASYFWRPDSQITAAITVSPATTTTYTVIGTSTFGCKDSASAVVTVTPPFIAGNVVVDRIGDGTVALTGSAFPVFIDQYNSSALNQLTPITSGQFPSAAVRPTAAPFNLMETGTATSDGYISRSNDGTIIVVPGYNGIPGDAFIASSDTSLVSRTVGIVGANTILTTPTSIKMMSTANFRSAGSDGTQIWGAASGSGGLVYIANKNATTATTIFSGNARTLSVQYGQLYATSQVVSFNGAGSSPGVWKIGSGLPSTNLGAAPSVNVVQEINTGTGASPYGFSFNATQNICYVGDDRSFASGGGIQKWTKSGSVWSLAYTIKPDTTAGTTTGARGIVVDYSGPNAIIYATTTETTNNKLIKVTDMGSAAASVAVTLARPGTNKVFRGVAFAPVQGGILAVNSVGFNNDFGIISIGDTSASASFQVAGSSLSQPLTITPPTGYLIRIGTNPYASSAIILLPTPQGNIANTVIDVRFAPTILGPQNGLISLSSPGAIDQQLSVTGIGQQYFPPNHLAVTLISPTSPIVNTLFSVTVRPQDSLDHNQNLSVNTPFTLSITVGGGILSGTLTGVILAGTNSLTISGLSYNVTQDSVQITATADRTSPTDSLFPGSKYFDIFSVANHLAFVNLPATGLTGGFFPTNGTPGGGTFTVQARRTNNQVDNAFLTPINISLVSGPGTLTNLFPSNSNGIGTFGQMVFSAPGIYVIQATSVGLPTIQATVEIIDLPAVTDVIFPKYAVTNSATARLPFVCRLHVDGLGPNLTYRYFSSGSNGASNAGNFFVINNTSGPAGHITGHSSQKALGGTAALMSGDEFSSLSRYGEFQTDAAGSYEGWFSIVPTTNAIFVPGSLIVMAVSINDGHGGSNILTNLFSNGLATMMDAGNNVDSTKSSRAVRGTSYASPENMIFIYDNTDGLNTDQPLWGTWAEKDGITTNFTSWYNPQVDTTNGAWGAYIPRNLPNGIQRIEQRSVATAAIVGCPAVDADGVWPDAGNTVNPTGGTSPQIVFSTREAGLAETYAITSNPSANGSITTGGTFACGTSPVFIIFPDACFKVADVLVDGVSVGAVTSYTFTNLLANHTITPTFAPVIQVDSLNPTSGIVGSAVTIYGYGFTGATDVQFNGLTVGALNYAVVNDTQITAIVPTGATSGPVKVIRGACDASSATSFTVISTNVTLNLKLFIQGYYAGGGLMKTPLYTSQQTVVPDPFPGITFGPNDCDSIKVELRNAATPSAVEATAMAMLHDDGTASATLPGSVNGGHYYIAVFHQNSIQTWSADSVLFGSTNTYNFSDDSLKAFEGNMRDLGELPYPGGPWAFFSGDMDQNENVDLSDFDFWDADNTNFVFGYNKTDLNGDSNTDLSDFDFWDANNTNFVYSHHPF